jgi:hypothetical protein
MSKKLIAVLCLFLATNGHASDLWTNVLATSRAITWAGNTGVQSVTPPALPSDSWTQHGSTIAACGTSGARVTPANCGANPGTNDIVTQLAACGTNHYVLLGSGTFWLNGGITIPSNCELRGSGANNTILDNTGTSSWYWGLGQILFKGNYDSASDNGAAPGFGGCAGTCTQISWTGTAGSSGTYTKGGTVLDLSATATGLSAGMMLMAVQNDDTAITNSYPACSATSIACSLEGNSLNTHGTAQRQNFKVVSISGTGASTQVTVTPPIYNDNWRTGQTPIVYYQACCNTTNAGVAALTVKDSLNGQMYGPISMFMADNIWVNGVVVLPNNGSGVGHGSGARDGILIELAADITIQNSFIGPAFGGGESSTTSYGIEAEGVSGLLILNNIFYNIESPVMLNDGVSGTVRAYNYAPSCAGGVCTSGDTGLGHHGAAEQWRLDEGNIVDTIRSDNFHGTADFDTQLRNCVAGPCGGTTQDAMQEMALNRYTNYVGNVIAPGSSSNYACLAPSSSGTCGRYNGNVYWIGYCNASSSSPCVDTGTMAYDTLSPTYFMRWGNWDIKTNAVRWCGNSSDTGWVATCGSATEIPSSLGSYAAIIPTLGDTVAGQGALPSSFFFASKPTFFASGKAWPLIGPDVTSGNIAGVGGFANTNPAEDCYTSISGNSANFNAGTCYPVTTQANAPTFSPVAGTYTGTQVVTVTSTTAGGVICYNTTDSPPPQTAGDGATCTQGSPISNGGTVTVSSTETLYAVEGTAVLADSSVAVAAYTINAAPSSHLMSGGVTINGGVVVK